MSCSNYGNSYGIIHLNSTILIFHNYLNILDCVISQVHCTTTSVKSIGKFISSEEALNRYSLHISHKSRLDLVEVGTREQECALSQSPYLLLLREIHNPSD